MMRQYAISLFIRRVYSFLQFQVIMVVNPIFGLSVWQQVYSIQSAHKGSWREFEVTQILITNHNEMKYLQTVYI